jgi:hypothetical protein
MYTTTDLYDSASTELTHHRQSRVNSSVSSDGFNLRGNRLTTEYFRTSELGTTTTFKYHVGLDDSRRLALVVLLVSDADVPLIMDARVQIELPIQLEALLDRPGEDARRRHAEPVSLHTSNY